MATRLQHLQLLIIDEILMIGEPMLRMVNTWLCHLFGDAEFGGKSVIAVGDFHQLRPVMAAPVYGNRSCDPYTEAFGKPLWLLFQVYKLTTVMRQDEQDFKKALTNLAHGQLTPADEALFQSCTFSELPSDAVKHRPIFLFSSNAEVDKWNEKV
ncbi:unnamed protein product, partial [Gongylonema pulchrum]|uniref:ATP-dependent DNA helicase n=1 Tax=Gongylonema pulchrum TaxID=637853 RepID=A0A183DBA4_9BILA